MNSHPENLAAWLDDELPQSEASAITGHVEHCAECRARAASYAEVTAALLDLRPSPRRRLLPLAGLAAAVAAIILAVALWERPVPLRPAPSPVVAESRAPERRIARPAPPPAVAKPATRRTVAPRRRPAPAFRQAYDGPVIRVALPADDLFAPGAVPRGAEIYADVTLAADGSLRELRLLP